MAWYRQPLLIAAIGAVIGAAVAALVVYAFLSGNDGGGDSIEAATPTPAVETATFSPTIGTPEPASVAELHDAIAQVIQAELGVEYLRECPQTSIPPGAENAVCASELHQSDELATFFIRPPFDDPVGEVVLVPDASGVWSATFIAAPAPGAQLAIGEDALIYASETCLNIRGEPRPDASVATCQLDGTRATVLEGPVSAGGAVWWRLAGLGWASAQYLIPAPQQ
jgi:hypothetical protein